MDSVFSFGELGIVFSTARADFSANFRAQTPVRDLPSGNYRLRIVACCFVSTPGREHLSFRLEVTRGEYCGRRINHSVYVFAASPQQRRRELTRLRTLQDAVGLGSERLQNTDDFRGREFGGGLWQHVCEGVTEIDLVRFYRPDFSWPETPEAPAVPLEGARPVPALPASNRRESGGRVPRMKGQFSGIFRTDSVQ